MPQEWEHGQAQVRSLQAQGYSEADIQAAMRQAGWEEGQITVLLAPQALPVAQPPPGVPPMYVQPPMPLAPPPGAEAAGSPGRGRLLIGLLIAGGVLLLALVAGVAFLLAHAAG